MYLKTLLATYCTKKVICVFHEIIGTFRNIALFQLLAFIKCWFSSTYVQARKTCSKKPGRLQPLVGTHTTFHRLKNEKPLKKLLTS